jgi:ATP synthase protein I
LGTKGLFIIIFILLGIIGGGVTVYRQILDITKDAAKDQNNPQNGIR